jgi:hypothetical protein
MSRKTSRSVTKKLGSRAHTWSSGTHLGWIITSRGVPGSSVDMSDWVGSNGQAFPLFSSKRAAELAIFERFGPKGLLHFRPKPSARYSPGLGKEKKWSP